MNHNWRPFSLFCLSIILLIGCARKSAEDDKAIFKYNESVGIQSLDPAYASGQAALWPCNMLYNGLVDLDENLQVIPMIAKSWSISEDGKTYTFLLRNDVFFHQNSP